MSVNILNLPGITVLDFKETDAEYHVSAEPAAISRLCSQCEQSNGAVTHAQKTLFARDLSARQGSSYMCLMSAFDDDYEMVTKTRQGNLGTDLSTLNVLFDSGQC